MFVLHLAGTSKHDLHYRREAEVNTTLEELLLYFVFLINLCIRKYTAIAKHASWTSSSNVDVKSKDSESWEILEIIILWWFLRGRARPQVNGKLPWSTLTEYDFFFFNLENLFKHSPPDWQLNLISFRAIEMYWFHSINKRYKRDPA